MGFFLEGFDHHSHFFLDLSIALITSGHVENAKDLTINLGNKRTTYWLIARAPKKTPNSYFDEHGDWETILFGRWHLFFCGLWGAKQKYKIMFLSFPPLFHYSNVRRPLVSFVVDIGNSMQMMYLC